jgi:hypothetical protein
VALMLLVETEDSAIIREVEEGALGIGMVDAL